MQKRTRVRYEYKEYRKLPVISPRRAYKRRGLYPRGLIQTGIEKTAWKLKFRGSFWTFYI